MSIVAENVLKGLAEQAVAVALTHRRPLKRPHLVRADHSRAEVVQLLENGRNLCRTGHWAADAWHVREIAEYIADMDARGGWA